jgi:serine/threonine protein kinase
VQHQGAQVYLSASPLQRGLLPGSKKGEAAFLTQPRYTGLFTLRCLMIETIPSGTILHGHYRIEHVLGSGGFGHVYLGMDLATNQQYALKEYLVSGANAQEQLKHEATVLSQLHHPNLPAFQDAFIERGRYYVVLNYIEGNDLTDIIRIARQRNDTVPIRQIMGWILSICDAVMFLHVQHPPVIHRDIKPDNIRITSNGTAILVDLGNAKASADGARTLFFIRHQGTPGYAPPEQYPGGTGTDTRSDVYALGGTLYFALTAHEPPSVSTRNQAAQQNKPDLPSLQEQLASNPPENNPEANELRQFRLGVTKPTKPAPRHSKHLAQLGTLSPALLDQLNRVIQRSMALKPKDRYQHVADLANDLKQIMKALPQPTPPPGTSRPLDPNSTQPDLPMLYDALQAAKEQKNQGGQGVQVSAPSIPNTPQPASSSTCPVCGTEVLQKSAFCPRCGTALGSSTPSKGSNTYNASAISDDQTMLIKPSQKPMGAHNPGYPSSQAGNASVQVASSAAASAAAYPGQNTTFNGQVQQGMSTNGDQTPSSPSSFSLSPRVIIFLLIILALIIALLLILTHR